MNVILAVTNQQFVAEAFFSQYYPQKYLSRPITNQGNSPGLDYAFAEWKTIVDGEEVLNWIAESSLSEPYNVVYIPYQAFACVVYRERLLERRENRFVIAAMHEKFSTPIINRELFNLLLDTKYKPGFSLFKELFTDMDHNILLDPEYDIIMEDIEAGNIALLSDNIVI
jgi:hypothetical protein